MFDKKYLQFGKYYLALAVLSIGIELIGSLWLKLWSYKIADYQPTIDAILAAHYADPVSALGWLMYPIILMHFKSLYDWAYSFIPHLALATLLAMVLGILFWEIPNVYSQDWIYTIPYIQTAVFGVNVVVIIGWVLLIQPPVLIYKYLNKIN